MVLNSMKVLSEGSGCVAVAKSRRGHSPGNSRAFFVKPKRPRVRGQRSAPPRGRQERPIPPTSPFGRAVISTTRRSSCWLDSARRKLARLSAWPHRRWPLLGHDRALVQVQNALKLSVPPAGLADVRGEPNGKPRSELETARGADFADPQHCAACNVLQLLRDRLYRQLIAQLRLSGELRAHAEHCGAGDNRVQRPERAIADRLFVKNGWSMPMRRVSSCVTCRACLRDRCPRSLDHTVMTAQRSYICLM